MLKTSGRKGRYWQDCFDSKGLNASVTAGKCQIGEAHREI